MTRAAALLPLLALCFALPADAASNSSWKTTSTPGSACRVLSGTATYTSFGSVKNESTTQTLQLECPLGYLQDDNALARLVGYVAARAYGTSVTCTLFVENAETGSFDQVTASAVAMDGRQMIELSYLDMFNVGDLSPVHAFCTIGIKPGAPYKSGEIFGFETQGYW